MLIGHGQKRPDLKTVRRIKGVLYETLALPEGAMITVTELACLEDDCAPLETVIGLLRPGVPLLQYKIHKAMNAVDAEDLARVCERWGHSIQSASLEPLLKEND